MGLKKVIFFFTGLRLEFTWSFTKFPPFCLDLLGFLAFHLDLGGISGGGQSTEFLDHEASYLAHLLNQEVPPTNLTCSGCHIEAAQYHCLDCYGHHFWCCPCLIKSHAHHPFHCPQQLKDRSFKYVPLLDVGYVLVLSHSSSVISCSEDSNLFGDRQMTLVHVNGVFEHYVKFCSTNSFLFTGYFL